MRDTSSEWRTARVDTWAPALETWICGRQIITIRPEVSLKALTKQISEQTSEKVRLVLCLDAK